MKTIIAILTCAILLSCTATHPTKTQLETYMDAQAEIKNFAGTVLVTRNDSILLKKAYGLADYEWNIKNTINTKFSLASVSKQFTAVAILQLAEANKLSLDDKLATFYPDFPEGDDISIRMLLAHNAGISDQHDDIFSSNTALESDAVVKEIMKKPLLFSPGTSTAYSNTAYYILTTLIEKTANQSFSSYLKEHVFDRAKMMNSGVSSNDSIVAKMARAYYQKDGVLIKNPYTNWRYNIGLDGIYSTVEDLYLWNKHLFDSTTVLSEASKQMMFKSYNEHSFGYGVLVNPFYNHGRSLVAHDGGYFGTQTSLNKFVDDNVLVTVLSNNGSASYLLAYALSAIVFGIPVELPYEPVAVEVDPSIYQDYVGHYEGVKIHTKENQLLYSEHDILLIPESNTKFFRADNNQRTVEFIKNRKGETIQIIMSKAGVKEIKNKVELR